MHPEIQPRKSQRQIRRCSSGKENTNEFKKHSESECDSDSKFSIQDAAINRMTLDNSAISNDKNTELMIAEVSVIMQEVLTKVEHILQNDKDASEYVLKGSENSTTSPCGVNGTFPTVNETKNCMNHQQIKAEKEEDAIQNTIQSTSKTVNDLKNDDKDTTTNPEVTMTSNCSGDIITKSMIDEEERFQAEMQASLDEVRERAQKELARTGKKQRYDRLQLLLDQSQLYSTYILQRMKSRQKTDEKRQERLARLRQKQLEKKEVSTQRRGSRIRKPKTFADETNTKSNSTTSQEEHVELKKSQKKRKAEAEELKEKKNKRQRKGSTDNKNGGKKSNEDDEDIENLLCIPEIRYINGERIPDRQPVLLTGGVMRNYQLDGVDWLRGLFENGINGILADEMGLGKTIQSIALVCALIENGVYGPYLIAAPLSTLPNWISEFKKFAPELHTILYHGNQKERAHIRRKMMRIKRYSYGLASLPVVVSSYEILMRDRPLLENYNIEWKYLIVDEGHRLKNLNCRLIRELKQYRCSNRLLLTGTPLQNNLSELWSLLNFLLPDIFDDLNSFQSWFDFSAIADNEKLIAQEQETKVLKTIHSVLTPFLLRRLKTDVDLSIPPKKEVLVYAPLTEKQQIFYKSTLDRTILDMISPKNVVEVKLELTPSGRPKRKSTAVAKYKEVENSDDEFDLDQLVQEVEMQEKRKEETEAVLQQEKMNRKAIVNVRLQNIMMQLRKCCNHPYLLEYPFDPKTEELIIDERLVQCSGKMLMLDRMLPALRKLGHKILLFSQMTQMLDILGDYCRMRDYRYSRIDGTMSVQERQENIEKFRCDPDNFIFLLSTRSGGLGLNLMMADTCIIYDSDWNPQVDLQAQDRCHRIGQTKPVVIYRLVTGNTVDQKIIERAANKRKLEKMVIHKKNFKGRGFASAITPQELVELLESTDTVSSVNLENIITEEHLRQLLDRSDMDGWDKPRKDEITTATGKKDNKSNVNSNDCRELGGHDGSEKHKNVQVDSKNMGEKFYKVVGVSADDNIMF